MNRRYCNAAFKGLCSQIHHVSKERLAGPILNLVNVHIEDADFVTLFCDAWTAPGHGSLRSCMNAVVLLHKEGYQDRYYFIDSKLIRNYTSENGDLVVYKIGIQKLAAISSDNVGMMRNGFFKLQSIDEYKDIMFYTCAAHAINNFSKIIVNGVRRKMFHGETY